MKKAWFETNLVGVFSNRSHEDVGLPWNMIEKRLINNEEWWSHKKFDFLYSLHESMWHFENILKSQEIDSENISDVLFLASSVAFSGILDSIKEAFKRIGISELFNPDFTNTVEKNVFTYESNLGHGNFSKITISKISYDDLTMQIQNETEEIDVIKKAEQILIRTRNKIVHPNSSTYKVVHISGNYNVPKNCFVFRSSFVTKNGYMVNKRIFLEAIMYINEYCKKNEKNWNTQIKAFLLNKETFLPIPNGEWIISRLNKVRKYDWGELQDFMSPDIYYLWKVYQVIKNDKMLEVVKAYIGIHKVFYDLDISDEDLEALIPDMKFSSRTYIKSNEWYQSHMYIIEKLGHDDDRIFMSYFDKRLWFPIRNNFLKKFPNSEADLETMFMIEFLNTNIDWDKIHKILQEFLEFLKTNKNNIHSTTKLGWPIERLPYTFSV